MIVNKKVFKVKIDDKEVDFAAIRPNVGISTQAELIHSKSFRTAIEGGAMVRAKLESVMREQSLWDDVKEQEFQKCNDTLLKGEMALKKGGIKLAAANAIAIDMRIARFRLQRLNADRNQLDAKTAEYFADNAKFNFLISQCVVYADTGKPYYESYEDYQSRQNDPVTGPAAEALASVIYGLQDDFESKLPENKFLLKHKLCNAELHLIDKNGNLIDSLNRPVDKEGNLINADGHRVDESGNLLDEDGEYIVDSSAFLDDDGKPIVEAVEVIKQEEVMTPSEPTIPDPSKADVAA